jgi:shikimate dehydrogenase
LDTLSKKSNSNWRRKYKNNKKKSYNTDYYGFKSHCNLYYFRTIKALILGTGGASKGVAFALDELGITYTFVSRTQENTIDYKRINATHFDNYHIIINATPVEQALT